MSNIQDLIDVFRSLSADIQQWLNSQSVLSKMIVLNNLLNLKGARRFVLPDLIFRLVTKDLEPQDFVSTLALALKVSDGAARGITRELEKEILHPIEDSLRVNAGVELQMLHFSGGGIAPSISKLESSTTQTQGLDSRIAAPRDTGLAMTDEASKKSDAGAHRDIVAPGIWKHIDALTDEAQPVTSNQQLATSVGPVILHTEEEATKPQEQAPRPIFSVKIPANKKQYVGTPAPLAARVEVPEEVQSSKFKVQSQKEERQPETRLQPPMRALSEIKSVAPKSVATPPKIIPVVAKIPLLRVVHYSDWRTLI